MVVRVDINDLEKLVFGITQKLLDWDEPIPPFSTRSPGKLESCLDTPFGTFDGQDLYPSLVDKAAIMFYLMIKNHPFQNGNKRIATTTLLFFLFINKQWVSVDEYELYQFAKKIADSSSSNKDLVLIEITSFVQKYLCSLPPDSDLD